MVAPNNPLICQITYQMLRDTRILENTFHLYKSDGWDLLDLDGALVRARDIWLNFAKPAIPSAVSLFNVHAHVYDPDNSPWVSDISVSPPVPGTRPGLAEAGNATVAVSKRAAYAGQRYRGRFFWPALSQSDTTQSDTIVSTLIVLLANFALQFFMQYPTGGPYGTAVLFHKDDNTFSFINSYQTDQIVDSMRRRLPGRGR